MSNFFLHFKYVHHIALSLLFLSLLLLGIEGLLRLKVGTAHIDDIGYIKKNGLVFLEPNADRVVTGGNFQPIHVVTNEDGFPTRNTTLTTPTGTIRIAFMGNSFTKGFEVDYTKKFTSRVEQLMNEAGAPKSQKYEVLNFGNGAYTFVEQLFIYETFVKKYQPHYVFLITYPPTDLYRNDLFKNHKDYILKTPIAALTPEKVSLISTSTSTTPTSTWELTRFKRRILSGISERINRFENNSNSFIKKMLYPANNLLTRLGNIDNATNQKDGQFIDLTFTYMDPRSQEAEEAILFSSKLALKLGQAVKKDGTHFGFIIIPNYWQVDPKYSEKLAVEQPTLEPGRWNRMFNETIGKIYPILDLYELCRRSIAEDHIQMFIRDTGHFTPTGHEIVAREIQSFITQTFKTP